ncbi:MAG TPA: hypothetical protein VKK79_24670 [Candidatus Lokiarchaeia archaeon]|nr:hypothetical protein [Candidatus Lokiarchaeia archaeon]
MVVKTGLIENIDLVFKFAEFGLMIVCAFFFFQKYKKFKGTGPGAGYYIGFAFFFCVAAISNLLFTLQFLDKYYGAATLPVPPLFPAASQPGYAAFFTNNGFFVGWVGNLLHPLYFFYLIPMLGGFISLFLPLERIRNPKSRRPFAIFTIVATLAMVSLVVLQEWVLATWYSVIVIILLLVAIVAGMALLPVLNIQLGRASPAGSWLRKRCFMIAIGIIIFFLGVFWMMDLGIGRAIVHATLAVDPTYYGPLLDNIIGPVITIAGIAMFLWGFSRED